MDHSDIHRRLPCELDISCTSTTLESRANIWYQQNAFKAPNGLGIDRSKAVVLLLINDILRLTLRH